MQGGYNHQTSYHQGGIDKTLGVTYGLWRRSWFGIGMTKRWTIDSLMIHWLYLYDLFPYYVSGPPCLTLPHSNVVRWILSRVKFWILDKWRRQKINYKNLVSIDAHWQFEVFHFGTHSLWWHIERYGNRIENVWIYTYNSINNSIIHTIRVIRRWTKKGTIMWYPYVTRRWDRYIILVDPWNFYD